MDKNFSQHTFLTLFTLLDKEYEKSKNHSLGSLLGSMNPDLFEESISADPAVYEDFCDCANDNFSKTYTADVRTAYLSAMQFLRKYRDDFGFELDDAIKGISFDVFVREFV